MREIARSYNVGRATISRSIIARPKHRTVQYTEDRNPNRIGGYCRGFDAIDDEIREFRDAQLAGVGRAAWFPQKREVLKPFDGIEDGSADPRCRRWILIVEPFDDTQKIGHCRFSPPDRFHA